MLTAVKCNANLFISFRYYSSIAVRDTFVRLFAFLRVSPAALLVVLQPSIDSDGSYSSRCGRAQHLHKRTKFILDSRRSWRRG